MNEPIPARSVHPRKVNPVAPLPVIAVSDEHILVARTNKVYARHELPSALIAEPPSVIAVCNHAAMVHELTEVLGRDRDWQFKATAVTRDIYKPDGTLARIKRVDTVVSMLGWSRTRPRVSKYHYPLDPITFVKCTPNELRPPDDPRLSQLLAWATDVQEWCVAQNLKIRATSGGLSAQLLKDPRFYPESRRKVPRATNAAVRRALPGNHYRLHIREKKLVDAMYLDMRSAHHWCAQHIPFPHSDRLYARGRFGSDSTKAWAIRDTPRYAQVLSEHGLLKVWLDVPANPPGRHTLPFMEIQGQRVAYVYTNELDLVRELGGRIDSVIAAWTSRELDEGLNRYARWALMENLRATDERRMWLKPVLLATYGILATRPRPQAFGYARAKSGVERAYPTSRGPLHVRARETGPCEPPTVNVIHRGMIEAEQRKHVIQLANELEHGGCEVLSLYADSLFVAAGSPLPLLPEPWIVKEELTALRFFTPTAFQSVQLTKLPGIPRSDMWRVRLREQINTGLVSDTCYYSKRRERTGRAHGQEEASNGNR